MSVTTLSREVRKICGVPRRGRPTAECSEILKILRSACLAKKNHTLSKRECRPKLKAGRPLKVKPKTAYHTPAKPRTMPKAKSALMTKYSIKKYTPGPRSASRKVPMPALPRKIEYCPDITFTAEETRFLRNPMASPSKKASSRARCESMKNSMGRECVVRMKQGQKRAFCVAKM